MTAPAISTPYRTLSVVALAAGLLLALGGVCGAVAGVLALPTLARGSPVANSTSLASLSAIGLLYGALLALTGWRLRSTRPVSDFRLPHPLIFLGLFIASLAVGQMVLANAIAPAILFPIAHILAAGAVPLAALGYAARRAPSVSSRSVLAQFTWGGLVSIVLALIVEIIIGALLFFLVLLVLVIVLGYARVNELAQRAALSLDDPGRLVSILSQEPVVLILAGLTAGLGVALLVPLVEELLKSLGPAILIARAKPSLGTALLWGVAAGAGYAFTENLLNAQGSLGLPGAGVGVWAGTMLLRGGTSLIHVTATATVAAGWHRALVGGKTRRLLGLAIIALGGHGAWNVLSIALGGALGVAFGQDGALNPLGLALALGVLGALGILLLGCVLWLRSLWSGS